jgi:hypothetical protein
MNTELLSAMDNNNVHALNDTSSDTSSDTASDMAAPTLHRLDVDEIANLPAQAENSTDVDVSTQINPDDLPPIQDQGVMQHSPSQGAAAHNHMPTNMFNVPLTTGLNMPTEYRSQHVCRIADHILGYMADVQKEMAKIDAYISQQKGQSKPLYQWAKYNSYRAISDAIRALQEKATKLEEAHLPEQCVKQYRRRARQFSTTISHSAVSTMAVMSDKAAICFDEIDESNLSDDGKSNAKALITCEIQKAIKYCTAAAHRTWEAFDMLEDRLLIEDLDERKNTIILKKLISELKGRKHASKGWFWSVAPMILCAATSAAIGLASSYLYCRSGFSIVPTSTSGDTTMYPQVLDLVQRTQAVTNLTGEIYSIKLQDLDQRYQELAAASEAHGFRIDNLVDALGPPNEDGVYYTSTSKPDSHVPEDIRQYIQKIADDSARQSQRLHNEMEQMRKNVNRMDIRLTKRIDKVDRYHI